jgi:hypothetical protein
MVGIDLTSLHEVIPIDVSKELSNVFYTLFIILRRL